MFDLIEDAMISRITAAASAVPGLGYKLPTVASYGGELDEKLDDVVRKFPAIWVTFAGCRASVKENSAGTKWRTPATFVTMCGSRNVRGERTTRQGVKVAGVLQEVGAYQMLKDVSLLLAGNDLGLAITRLKPGAIKTLYNTRLRNSGLAVFAREWHCDFIETQPREQIDPTSVNWLSVGINYYLQPDDGIADSSGNVILT